MKKAMRHFLILLASLALFACAGDTPGGDGDGDNGDGDGDNNGDLGTPGSGGSEFEHPFDPFAEYSSNLPDEVLATLHSCGKMPTGTVSRVLASRGIDIASTAGLSAGQLLRDSRNALGVANYDIRIRENVVPSAAGMTKLLDALNQGATEVIAAMEAGTVAGCVHPVAEMNPVTLFNTDRTQCRPEGIACLTGTAATSNRVDLCNQILNTATPEVAERMAAAVVLAGSLMCE